MKKSLFILLTAAIMMININASQAKNNENDKVPAETVGQAENSTVKLTKALFLEKVWDYESSPKEWKFRGDKPALIDFYADWCGPCRTAAPILEEVAKEYAGKIVIYKVDTQVERELSAIFGVRSLPTFFYIPIQGKPTPASGIARSKEDTKKIFIDNIEKLLLANN